MATVGRARRNPYRLLMPICSMEVIQRMFGSRCVMLWNRLPLEIVGVNSLTFKRLLADHWVMLYMSLSSGSFVYLLAGFKLA